MRKLKFLITFFIIIILVLLCIILFVPKKELDNYETVISTIEFDNKDIELVKDESEYHDIERIFNKYLNYINYNLSYYIHCFIINFKIII